MRTENTTWQRAISTPTVNTASPKDNTESGKKLMLAGQREIRAQYRQAAKQTVSSRPWVTADVASQRLANVRSNPPLMGANRAWSHPAASKLTNSSVSAHALPERTTAMRAPRMGGVAPAGPKQAPQTAASPLLTPDQELDLLLGNDRSFDGVEALLVKHETAQVRTDSVKLEGGELGRATLSSGTVRHEEELGSKSLPDNPG